MSSPSPSQLRNRQWIATHTTTVALIGGVIGGLGGLVLAVTHELGTIDYLILGAGGFITIALGGIVFSWGMQTNDKLPRGKRGSLSVVIIGLLIAVAIGLRLLRYNT